MPEDHERIEELVAGYVLLSLSAEDAIEADRLLSEHVPSCPMCRDVLAGFGWVAGELAFAPRAAAPPDLLLPRIRGELEDHRRVRRPASLVAVAAGVAALVGMAALSVSLGTRAERAESQRDRMIQLVDAISQPGAATVRLDPVTQSAPRLLEVSEPEQRMIVAGRNVPLPAPQAVYVLWVGSENGFQPVRTFTPDEFGFVYFSCAVDVPFDRILITEERLGTPPAAPATDSPHVWLARL